MGTTLNSLFSAEHCRETGLPMYQIQRKAPPDLFTKSQCNRRRQPIGDNEEPVAFLRAQYGYCGLYRRTEAPEPPKRKQNIPVCAECPNREGWTCHHTSIKERLWAGKYIEDGIQTSPHWCPRRKCNQKGG